MGALKGLAITGVTLAVLGGGAVVGDNLARSHTQNQVADQLQTALGLAERPGVELGGLPFSQVFISHQLPSARLTAVAVPLEVSGRQLALDTVEVVAQDVTIDGERITLGSARAEGVLGYPALTQLAGVPVEPGGEAGRVRVSYTAELFGKDLVVAVSAVPVLNDDRDRLLLNDPEIQLAGFELSDEIAEWIMNELIAPIELDLPYGLSPESVAADQSGVKVAVSARDFLVPQG